MKRSGVGRCLYHGNGGSLNTPSMTSPLTFQLPHYSGYGRLEGRARAHPHAHLNFTSHQLTTHQLSHNHTKDTNTFKKPFTVNHRDTLRIIPLLMYKRQEEEVKKNLLNHRTMNRKPKLAMNRKKKDNRRGVS